MKIVFVNGSERQLSPDARISDLVLSYGLKPDQPGIAVAKNDEVVPRSMWAQTELAHGDAVEIIHATQGG